MLKRPSGFAGLLLLFAAGCGGGLPDLPTVTVQDAGPEADAISDAATVCDVRTPFSGPMPLVGTDLVTGTDYAPGLSADELMMFFSSARTSVPDAAFGNIHIYVTTRPNLSAPFGPSIFVASLNSAANESDPLLSPDGLTIYFQSDRAAGNHVGDIYAATRPSLSSDFSAPVAVTSVNSSDDDTQPALDADGAMWLARASATSDYDLYRAPRVTGGFATPAPETELNTAGTDDWSPTLSADGLTIYFASKRPGGVGGNDVWVATRPALSSPFSGVTDVTELNTSYDEMPHWLSPDGCRLYMTRGHPGAYEMYVATRSP